MRVRRSSDNAEADIGFSDDWLDETALLDHVGTGGTDHGYVAKWYDQSGNARDAIQATAGDQALIVDNGAVVKYNLKPALLNGCAVTASFASQSQPNTICGVGRKDTGVNQTFCDGIDGNRHFIAKISDVLRIYAGTNLNGTTGIGDAQIIYTALFDGASSLSRINGSAEASGNAGTSAITGLTVGDIYFGGQKTGYDQELVFWDSDQTSNFSAIESDINTAFGVY